MLATTHRSIWFGVFLALFAWTLAPDVVQAKHNNNKYHYDIDGTLKMRPAALNAYGSPKTLGNVQVKISGKVKAGTWSKWTKTRTRSDGSFSHYTEKGKPGPFNFSKRKFRIQVKFKSSNLEVRHGNATSATTKVKWYTIYKSGWETGKDLDLNGTFEPGGSRTLGDFEPRRHAQIWYLYRDVRREMSRLGHAFTNKIKVKYPHDGVAGDKAESSYANPTNKVIYMVKNSEKDQFQDDVLVHELMHIWAYQHTGGEGNVSAYFANPANGFDTHGRVSQSYVAVHEGIAEYNKDKLMERMFSESLDQPFSRHAFGSNFSNFDKVNNFNDVVHHDKGWWTLFNLMSRSELYKYEFRTNDNRLSKASCGNCSCNWGRMSFRELLDVIDNSHTRDMNYSDFFGRIRNQVNGIGGSDQRMYRKLLDPNSNYEPTSDICSSCPNERCNGKDDDCDERADENLTRSCGNGTGQCQQGTETCSGGSWGSCRGSVSSASETCNGRDDDCDGTVDEGCNCENGDTRPCGESTGACQQGTQTCEQGQWGSCSEETGPSSETCNGRDDDCDGQTDENLMRSCGASTGACEEGTETCSGGSWGSCRGSVSSASETCNGRDDDCDGSVDEGASCGGCTGDACAADAGSSDVGPAVDDAGVPDASTPSDDAGPGGGDASTADAGDASPPSDAGRTDAVPGTRSDADATATMPDAGGGDAADAGSRFPEDDDDDDDVQISTPFGGCTCGSTSGRSLPGGAALALLLGLAWMRRRRARDT